VASAIGVAALLGAVWMPRTGRAETVSVEAVGAVAARSGAREAALQAGLREALLRVATELARSGGAATEDPEALATALGDDPYAYVVRFELVEDRGEGPAQLVAGADREYVVVVRAQVERSRVRERLRRAGLLGGQAATRRVSVVFEGVATYPVWERLERALGARGGRIRPVEFARGRVVTELETDESNEALLARLERAAGEAFQLSVEEAAGETLRLRVTLPPPELPEPADEASGTPPPI
jgi:hypothetical protein